MVWYSYMNSQCPNRENKVAVYCMVWYNYMNSQCPNRENKVVVYCMVWYNYMNSQCPNRENKVAVYCMVWYNYMNSQCPNRENKVAVYCMVCYNYMNSQCPPAPCCQHCSSGSTSGPSELSPCTPGRCPGHMLQAWSFETDCLQNRVKNSPVQIPQHVISNSVF